MDFNEERNDYQKRELTHFINMTLHKEAAEEGFHHAIQVLELTQGRISI